MAPAELARRCAAEIVARFADDPHLTPDERLGLAELYVRGAIIRALTEHDGGPAARLDTPSLGAVDLKVTKSTQGVSLEVDCKRPRQPGDSWDQAISASALYLAVAYTRATEQLGKIGLTPGRETKP